MSKRIEELIKSRGIIPEDEHYEIAELVVRECLKEIKDMVVDEGEELYPNNKQTTKYVNERLMDTYDNISGNLGITRGGVR